MAHVAVAVSGGVDSLAALLLLKQAGHNVIAVHGLFRPGSRVPPSLADVCDRAGVPLHMVDLTSLFASEVIAAFRNAYFEGRTPNPCAICNRVIKFGALQTAAMGLGADLFATGHYAKLVKPACLLPAMDARKDQSYFLSLVPAARLESVVFPLHDLVKEKAREIVSKADLSPPLKEESQDICFLAGEGPAAFLGKTAAPANGPVLLRLPGQEEWELSDLRVIGHHNGSWRYTVGQRKGLGIPWREPLHVREVAGNAVVLAPRALLNMTGCSASQLNIFIQPEAWRPQLYARFRYRQKPCPVKVEIRGNKMDLHLLEPALATAPGQVAAVYDSTGRLLAGAIVEKARIG